jgi:DNA-binding transcriptional LysR family regulator
VLFDKHGIEPTRVVEADEEGVIASLVQAGVGLSLIGDDIAQRMRAAGDICLWQNVRLETVLWFIYSHERAADPVVRALLDVLDDTWRLHEAPGAPATRKGCGAG